MHNTPDKPSRILHIYFWRIRLFRTIKSFFCYLECHIVKFLEVVEGYGSHICLRINFKADCYAIHLYVSSPGRRYIINCWKKEISIYRYGQIPILDVYWPHIFIQMWMIILSQKWMINCSFLYIVRNLCKSHPNLDVSCLPKLDDIQNQMCLVFQNRMFLVFQNWMVFIDIIKWIFVVFQNWMIFVDIQKWMFLVFQNWMIFVDIQNWMFLVFQNRMILILLTSKIGLCFSLPKLDGIC